MEKSTIRERLTAENIYLALIQAFVATAYITSLPRSVTFEDAGLFLSTGAHWGIPHPPGYPLYTFLMFLFMKIPFGTPAYMASLLSSFLGLGSARVAYAIFKRVGISAPIAMFGFAALALGQTFWNQMIVPEVYALHVLIFLSLVYCCLRLREEWAQKYLWKSVILFGLGLSNHWPLLILTSPMLFLILWPQRQKFFRNLHYLGVSLVVALVFYGIMYWRSHAGGPFLFLGPIDGVTGLLKYIARSYYSVSDSSAPFMPLESIKFVLSFLYTQLWVELTPIAGAVFLYGVWLVQKEYRNSLGLALLFAFFSTPVLLMFALHFEFNELNYNVYRVFHLIPHFVFVWVLCVAMDQVLKRGYHWGALLGFVILIHSTFINGHKNDLSQDRFAEGYSKLILDAMPQDAKLFASTDADVGPLAYVNGVLDYRDDVKLMTQTGVFFPTRIFDPYEFGRNFRTRETRKFLQENAPLYSTKRFDLLSKEKNLNLKFDYNGIFYLIDSSYTSEAPKTPEMVQEAVRLAEIGLKQAHLFNWQYHRDVVMGRLCNLMVLNSYEDHEVFEKNRACKIIKARHYKATKRHKESSDMIRQVIEEDSRFMIRSELLDLYYTDLINQMEHANTVVKGSANRLNHVIESVDYARKGLELHEECDNPIYELVASIKPQLDWTSESLEALKVFKGCESKKNKKSKSRS